jgi:hypothetical protein
MAKVKSWSGNATSDFSISSGELHNLALFCQGHEAIYIFGAGKIGSALMHYLEQSELPCAGFVTSETLNKFRQEYSRGKTGIIVGVGDNYLQEVVSFLSVFISENDVCVLSSEYRERLGRQLSAVFVEENFWINVFVTNKCNLGCKSCSAFAPAMSFCNTDTDYEPAEFKRDIAQLKNLKLTKINCLKFTGGEPFLHSGLFAMFRQARLLFPDTPIECYTSGLLLGKLDVGQLTLLKNLEITLTITEYPLQGFDLSGFYKTAAEFGLDYNTISKDEQKYFSKRPLDFDKRTPKYCFFDCPRYAMCNSLFMYRGRLWKCIYSFMSKAFNEAFSTELIIDERDCLDMYRSKPQEIYLFAIRRIPFCGYCKPITELIPWGLSERKIEEWT